MLLQAFIDLPVDIRDQCELHFAGRFWEGAKDFFPKILSLAKKFPNIFYHGELRDRKKNTLFDFPMQCYGCTI